VSDEDIYQKLVRIWEKRDDRYSDERQKNAGKTLPPKSKIEMSYIGG